MVLTKLAVLLATSLADWTKCLLATGLVVLEEARRQALHSAEVCLATMVAAESTCHIIKNVKLVTEVPLKSESCEVQLLYRQHVLKGICHCTSVHLHYIFYYGATSSKVTHVTTLWGLIIRLLVFNKDCC